MHMKLCDLLCAWSSSGYHLSREWNPTMEQDD